MKFIVSSQSLLKQLQQISGVLNSSNPLPILDNFLFIVEKGNLMISASDLESTMTTQISLIEGKQTGKIAVPAKILLETLKTFPEQPLTFIIDDKSHAIEIVSDFGKYKLTGFDGEEFPKVPSMDGGKSLEIVAGVMQNAIGKTLFATGNDELRPVMSGVFCQLSKENITFVATDAHKLVRYRRSDSKSKSEGAFIVPKKPLNLLKNIISDAEEKIKISYTDSNAFFEFGNYSLICRLIDGRYPNYEAVIPVDNPNKLTISRQALLNSVRRVSIFSNKTTHQVRLKINGSELHISAEDLDFANEANERLSCQYAGEDMEIGFNARFLSDMLSNLECEEVTVEMSAPNRAGILVPSNPENKDEDILMLVMPVMLNN
ncbi:MAG: DNA polymerase III subunit beta [Bacteroidetes bacterium]|jgi:DNA polymerase-3 subunit beta|nr:DNA polymerase III subunit beta [Bacteroidota bacterium]MBK9542633.1 DNA polymerase III subunit beta [Bacteroidota bacterium]MBL0256967.1 DNA polymerase III subunit beta [Bacteroidota bacterium]MBP6401564.1 DNA polymerase III subunit beta [Bacteroidia bacterium]MBP6650181.1 DNA polymerase III subunit beta [Bacteroidia bacterium]